ncbi:alanine--tRNA ligase [Penicillium digitatum]|uniref:Alanine--tRNA ligase n=1 Tax=Penicillium digitatum TaxID=36651 RepID=A0A7T7BNH4_PENDI|nr:alanine--tRNA ligase [Penicillium digitatum]
MWEISEQLHNEEAWGKWLELPSSVTRFCIDIESIERRKDEVDYIAGETVDQWRFQRANSTNMVAAKAHTTVPDTWVVPCLADGAGAPAEQVVADCVTNGSDDNSDKESGGGFDQ